jgi:hypothetical protein
MGAVRGAERIVHIQVAELRQISRQAIIVLFLAWIEARILDEENLPWL